MSDNVLHLFRFAPTSKPCDEGHAKLYANGNGTYTLLFDRGEGVCTEIVIAGHIKQVATLASPVEPA